MSVSLISALRLKSYLFTMRPQRVLDDKAAATNCYDGSDHDSTKKVTFLAIFVLYVLD